MQAPWVWSLVGELRSHLPGVQPKAKKEVSSLPHPIALEELCWNFHNSEERPQMEVPILGGKGPKSSVRIHIW